MIRQSPTNHSFRMPYRDSYNTAPGWREVGSFYTLVDNAVYPKNPAVTTALKAFDPSIVPMWVNWVFQAPSEGSDGWQTQTYGRHVLARYEWDPKNIHPPITPLEVPPNYSGPIPNILERVLHYGGSLEDPNRPGPYEPWDWDFYYRIVSSHETDPKKIVQSMVHDRVDAMRREKEARRAEDAYRQADLDRYVTKQLEKMSDVEMKDFNASAGNRQLNPKNLFLDLGR